MRTFHKASALLFLAAASVYPSGAILALPGKGDSSSAGKAAAPTVQAVTLPPIGAPGAGDPVPTSATPDTDANAQVTVSESGTFTIDVADADIVKVLRMLSSQSQKNIIASKDVKGSISANLHNVTIKEALDAILRANGFVYREKGNFIYVYTVRELTEVERNERQMGTEVFHVYYTPAEVAVNMIKPILSPEAVVALTKPSEVGIESSGAKSTGGNTHAVEDLLVIKDYTDNLDKARKLLKEIDRRPQQIVVEATIVRASLTEDNALGIDFTVLGGVDFSTISSAGATAGQALSGAILDNNKASGINDKGFGGASTGFTTGTQGVPPGGLRVGVVKNNVAAFLSALETTGHTHVLANPKILALNKQKGEVIVGKKTGYLTTLVTESTAVQSVEFLETGTRLIFRPFIGDDGYIRMEVHPEDSDGGLVNNLPVKTTTEVTSNIMVKDGHTVVIGGLFRESNEVDRGQVPFLGDLPGVGPLFRRQHDTTNREEIIILLTPRIVKDEKQYAQASEEMLKESEKLRVGVRQGMMWFGRERLAESAYQRALDEMNKPNGDRQKALWELDCATNLNPTFLEAHNLKQKISGKQISSVDNSSIRDFVRKQVMADEQARATTQPSADAGFASPATMPVVMKAATTQPIAVAPATQPATQPVAHLPTTVKAPFVYGGADTIYDAEGADDAAFVVETIRTRETAQRPRRGQTGSFRRVADQRLPSCQWTRCRGLRSRRYRT